MVVQTGIDSTTRTFKKQTEFNSIRINDISEDDVIELIEEEAPAGYSKLNGAVLVNVSKKISDGSFMLKNVTYSCQSSSDKKYVNVHMETDTFSDTVYIDLYDKPLEAEFNLTIQKTDGDANPIQARAGFKIELPSELEFVGTATNISSGTLSSGTLSGSFFDATGISSNGILYTGFLTGRATTDMIETTEGTLGLGTFKIYITEESAPVGYDGLAEGEKVELVVTTKVSGDKIVIASASANIIGGRNISIPVTFDETTNNIELKIPNEKMTEGKYQLSLLKVDKDTDKEISGAEFSVKVNGSDLGSNVLSGAKLTGTIDTEGTTTDTYEITEAVTPTGYVALTSPIKFKVDKTKSGDTYSINVVKDDDTDDRFDIVKDSLGVTIKIKNEKVEGSYKFQVQKLDKDGNGVMANFTTITPDGLRYSYNVSETNSYIKDLGDWEIYEAGTDEWIIREDWAEDGYQLFDKNIHVKIEKYFDTTTNKWDIKQDSIKIQDDDGNDISSSDVFLVTADDDNLVKIIVKNKKIEGKYWISYIKVDSEEGYYINGSKTILNVKKNDETAKKIEITTGMMSLVDSTDITSDGQVDTYVITEEQAPDGYVKLDKTITCKVYTHIEDGKYVVYNVESDSDYVEAWISPAGNVTFEVKNDKEEQTTGAYELELTKVDSDTREKLNGAKFEIKYPGNSSYVELELDDDKFISDLIEITDDTTTDVIYIKETEAPQGYDKLIDEIKIEVTKEVKDDKYVVKECKITNADGSDAPDGIKTSINNSVIGLEIPNKAKESTYTLELIKCNEDKAKLKDAVFEVTMPNGETKTLTTDADGRINLGTIDIDSEGSDEFIFKETKEPDGYQILSKEFKVKVNKVKTDDGYARGDVELTDNGQQVTYSTSGAQIRIEVINKKITNYDMSLRKFITSINGEAPEVSREPKVDTSKLVDGSSTTATYTHTKEPLLVANTDIVVYTLRMYNEGISSAYVAEVKDDIPVGLEFIVDNEINEKYGWKMYDADGTVTTDVTKAKAIRTDYLSKENSESRDEDNLLQAFDYKEDSELDYRDVQVAFKVTSDGASDDRIIINTAEITKETDENGKSVEDRDSTPNNSREGEDDIDKEYLRLKYFDLSLLKWVSSTIVTDNGKTTETLTGHTGLENPEPVVKVEINRKRLNQVTVKFAYTIKVTNEGELEGYVKEISDYIPDGLRFVAQDNPEWTEVDGKIVTKQLENTLLNPGESADVKVILTWNNSENNLGLKTNVAEISEDYNKYNEHDIDSTPNNLVEGEDDIDDAPVLLSISTGKAKVYVALITVIMGTLAVGIVLIKKFVLR